DKYRRKSPSSVGANFWSSMRFRWPINRMPFFSLPLMKSGPLEKKKSPGYVGQTMPKRGLVTMAVGQQNSLRKYSASCSFRAAPPADRGIVGLLEPRILFN